MIPVYRGQDAKLWLQQRGRQSAGINKNEQIEKSVRVIIEAVANHGDAALVEIATRFGDAVPRCVLAGSGTANSAISTVSPEARSTIEFAAERIARFAQSIMSAIKPVRVQFAEYQAGLDFKPVGRVACYVPGGRYPLPSTALMTALTAKAAGVKDICLFTPVLKPEIIFAGSLAGVSEFYELGGAQAVAAAAFGTETIKPVDMIVGPGNAYVTEAKRQLQGVVGIDMLAGPSEIAVIADKNGHAEWICMDLLSQAEHDPDARAYLLTDNADIANAVIEELPRVSASLHLPDFIQESLGSSAIVVLDSMADCIEAANAIAPEHLLLHVSDPQKMKSNLLNYGALFMGYNATVPYGDYTAGPNHTLPTNGTARFCGGLTPLTFLRTQSWLDVPACARELSEKTSSFARLEGLLAHDAAASVRLRQIDARANV